MPVAASQDSYETQDSYEENEKKNSILFSKTFLFFFGFRVRTHPGVVAVVARESVLFIGTRFSNLYTAVDTPAEVAWCCA